MRRAPGVGSWQVGSASLRLRSKDYAVRRRVRNASSRSPSGSTVAALEVPVDEHPDGFGCTGAGLTTTDTSRTVTVVVVAWLSSTPSPTTSWKTRSTGEPCTSGAVKVGVAVSAPERV